MKPLASNSPRFVSSRKVLLLLSRLEGLASPASCTGEEPMSTGEAGSGMLLVAPDSFKGTLSSRQVAAAIAAGVRMGGLRAVELPLADGGEGTAEVLAAALGGEWVAAAAHDPLGRPIDASYVRLRDGRAVVEAAAASGLMLLGTDELDPLEASTRGTGELIVAAAAAGAREVLVAVGGTATVDGGAGAVEAIRKAGAAVRIDVLCDVLTPWEDAASVYGPQKGADGEAVRELSARLDRLAARAPRDPRGRPFTGAGGGLSGGLWAYLGATLRSGAEAVLEAVGLEQALQEAVAAVTGEGRLDRQTREGKLVSAVAAAAARAGVPCHAIVGSLSGADADLVSLGLASVTVASTLEELERAGRRLAEVLTHGA